MRGSPLHRIEVLLALAVTIAAISAHLIVQVRLRRLGVWRSNGAILGSQRASMMRMIRQVPAGVLRRELLALHLLSLGALCLVTLLSLAWVSD